MQKSTLALAAAPTVNGVAFAEEEKKTLNPLQPRASGRQGIPNLKKRIPSSRIYRASKRQWIGRRLLWSLVVVTLFCCSSTLLADQPELKGGEWSGFSSDLLEIPVHLDGIPDCSIEYVVRFGSRDDTRRVFRHKFIKRGPQWRNESVWRGELHQVVCFDGEKYFYHDAGGMNLVVTRDPANLNPMVPNCFTFNPMYAWAFVFFRNASAAFAMPTIMNASEWTDLMAGFIYESAEQVEGGATRYRFKTFSDSYVVDLLEIGGEANGRRMVVRQWRATDISNSGIPPVVAKFEGWEDFEIQGQPVCIPRKISARSDWDETEIEFIEGSLAPLDEDLPDSTFQVPLSVVPDPIFRK